MRKIPAVAVGEAIPEDRLLVLGDGRIVHDGEAHTAEEVLDLMKAVG